MNAMDFGMQNCQWIVESKYKIKLKTQKKHKTKHKKKHNVNLKF